MTQFSRTFSGSAAATTITAPMTAGSPASGGGTFGVANGSGYPTANFVIVVDRGLSTEEKIFCSSRSANVLTVGTSGRGFDGTAAASHSNGATLEHELDATVMTAIAEHINTNAGDDHPTYLNVARHDLTARHAVGTVVPAGAVGDITSIGAAKVAGASAKAADAAHVHDIPDGFLTLAKLANLATARLLGRATAGTGVPEALTLDPTLLFAGTALQRAALTGAITAAAGSNVTALAAGTRTYTVCTSATHPGSPAVGDIIFETDTGKLLEYQSATTGWTPPWNTAWGEMDYKEVTANSSALIAGTDIVTGNAVTYVANRKLRITAEWYGYVNTAAGNVVVFEIKEGAATLSGISTRNADDGIAEGGSHIRARAITTAGSHTYKLYCVKTAGSGSVTMIATGAYPMSVLVEDMGPNGTPV